MLVSAFGPAALEVAARIGDGLVTTQPDADMVRQYKEKGGKGKTIAAVKICWAEDEGTARKTAHRLWATECLPGQLNQELALPSHFEQATSIVTEEMVADSVQLRPRPRQARRSDPQVRGGRLRRDLCEPDRRRTGRLLPLLREGATPPARQLRGSWQWPRRNSAVPPGAT